MNFEGQGGAAGFIRGQADVRLSSDGADSTTLAYEATACDLIDLRALDTRLANASLDYLNYDRLGKQEVHHHLSGGERESQHWIERYGIEPRKPLR